MPISTRTASDGIGTGRFDKSCVDNNAINIQRDGLEVINSKNLKSEKKSCKDVFNAFLVSLAYYAGIFEFPVIQPTSWVPNRLIPFSKAISCKDYDQWVHFYEFDYLFERVWRNPRRYLDILRRFNGVILPDFSVYRDMPFVMQLWNIYRSRALGFWLQSNGIKVIVNIRWGDKRTYRFCCDGVAKGCVIAVGTNGAIGSADDSKCQAVFPSRGKHFYFHLGKMIYPSRGKHFCLVDGKQFFPWTVSSFPIPPRRARGASAGTTRRAARSSAHDARFGPAWP